MGTLVSRTLTPILCLLPAPSLWLTADTTLARSYGHQSTNSEVGKTQD